MKRKHGLNSVLPGPMMSACMLRMSPSGLHKKITPTGNGQALTVSLTIRGLVDQLVLLFGQDVQDLWVYAHRGGVVVVLTDLQAEIELEYFDCIGGGLILKVCAHLPLLQKCL